MHRTSARQAATLVVILAAWACGGESPTSTPVDHGTPTPPVTPSTPSVATVVIASTSDSVEVGKTMQLTATARDAAGNALTGKTFTWSSSDTSAATVSAGGLVSGVDRGRATITATVDGQSGTKALTAAMPATLAFTPDTGARATNASVPRAAVESDGSVYLSYIDGSTNNHMLVGATSASNWLRFSAAAPLTDANRGHDPLRVKLPSGKWRLYQSSGFSGGFFSAIASSTSADGAAFAADAGTRYTAGSIDAGKLGVNDIFVDGSGGVVMLYLGDPAARNNIRRAYSTDDGWTFRFDNANVLGDSAAGGGAKTYVDPFSIALPDGRRRLFVMKANEIFSFISADGKAFIREPGTVLRPSDFTSFKATTLNDPTIVRLPDGRYRMYVASSVEVTPGTHEWRIVSATTPVLSVIP